MGKQNFRYQHFNTAIIRTPLFPLDALQKPDDFSESREFEEAIKLASPDMFQAKWKISQDKYKKRKAETSLYKYFIRSSSRCTPFGLFAGCSAVPISENETQIVLTTNDQYRRYTRLDMQYLCALIQRIENNHQVRSLLRFYPNDSLYSVAGQQRYVEYHYKNSRRSHQISSIGNDEFVARILDAAKAGLKPADLALLLVDDEITISDALEYVNEMIDSQILKSELEPAVVGEDTLTVLIFKLQQIGETLIANKLLQIKNILAKIDNAMIGESIGLYDSVIEVVKSIDVGYEEKFLFQTDLFKPVKSSDISKAVVEQLNDCIAFLGNINNTYQNSNIQAFKRDFFERYEYEEIPLATALDNELGIGYPINGDGSDINLLLDNIIPPARQSQDSPLTISPMDIVLLKKFMFAIKNGDRVIFIDETSFSTDKHHLEAVYPATCAAMCSIMKDGNNNSIIHLKSTWVGASLLGRFCHTDARIYELVKRVADFESDCKPDAVMVEISHLPESRIGNISSRPAFRDVIFHYLSNVDATIKQSLDISDLMLSVKNDRLYLRSKQLDKEIIPRLTCAHNFSITPIPIYRFMCDMQSQDSRVNFFMQWGELFKVFEYLPRIQYRDVILSRQRWSISQDEIKDCYKLSDSELLLFFASFVTRRKLPPRVVFPEGDNEMYVDFTDIRCLKLLLDIVKNRPSFNCYEFLFDEYDSIVTTENSNRYANEAIIIFHK